MTPLIQSPNDTTSAPPTRRRLWTFKATSVVLSLVFALLVVEFVVRVGALFGVCRIRRFQTADPSGKAAFVGDIDPHFGVWHPANTAVSVSTPRGAVTYETNVHGMRDRPRARRSDARERVIVLGDSFVEGYLVEEAVRVTDVLERRTGVEFLNFGVSGSFGSIQEWLLYKHLAREFDHTRVCLFFLPDNDFADNDPSRHPPDRYRPYLRKVGDSYEATYPVAFDPNGGGLPELTRVQRTRHHIYNHWYTLNILAACFSDEANNAAAADASNEPESSKRSFASDTIRLSDGRPAVSAYDRYTSEDLDRLLFTYRRISELAAPRPVHVFIVPRERDLVAHAKGRFEGRIASALEAFATETPGVEVVDLLPRFVAVAKERDLPYGRFFLGFDPHWSALGHEVAAEATLAALRDAGFEDSSDSGLATEQTTP